MPHLRAPACEFRPLDFVYLPPEFSRWEGVFAIFLHGVLQLHLWQETQILLPGCHSWFLKKPVFLWRTWPKVSRGKRRFTYWNHSFSLRHS